MIAVDFTQFNIRLKDRGDEYTFLKELDDLCDNFAVDSDYTYSFEVEDL